MGRCVLAYGLALILLFSTAACSGESDSADSIKMPSSSSEFAGEHYQDVVDDLQDAGFTNVQTRALGDLITGWLKTEGMVEKIKVDGDSVFSKNSRYPSGIKILVSYHSFPLDEEDASDAPVTEAPAEAEPVEPEPAPEPEPVQPPPAKLDEVYAAQHLADAWKDRMIYGGTVHWIADRITTANDDGTFTFKIGATIKNEYGTKYKGTIEGDVGGTNDAPVILDSIMYTDAGEVIDYYG